MLFDPVVCQVTQLSPLSYIFSGFTQINMEASEDNLSTQNELELGHAEQDSFGSVKQFEKKSSEK